MHYDKNEEDWISYKKEDNSNTEGYMTEVCWPGPALLISYEPLQKKIVL